MNRNEFKKLAKIRLKEAEALLATKNYSGAYYLFGYVIECGLKACIAKQTKRYEFPDLKVAQASWTHDLKKLVKTAGLETDLDQEIRNDVIFEANLRIVLEWSEESRYQTNRKEEAYDLYSAITDHLHGVLKWIEQHW